MKTRETILKLSDHVIDHIPYFLKIKTNDLHHLSTCAASVSFYQTINTEGIYEISLERVEASHL